jgi:cell division cycle 20-like protein 1 (cofactor of APC complex)
MGSASFDGSCPSSGNSGIGGPSNNGIHPLHSASSSDFTFPFSSGSKLMTNYNSTSSTRTVTMSPKKPVRKISKTPFKVLVAPSLQDDYYLNLVDWSHANILSVALGSSVYLWSACTSKVPIYLNI